MTATELIASQGMRMIPVVSSHKSASPGWTIRSRFCASSYYLEVLVLENSSLFFFPMTDRVKKRSWYVDLYFVSLIEDRFFIGSLTLSAVIGTLATSSSSF